MAQSPLHSNAAYAKRVVKRTPPVGALSHVMDVNGIYVLSEGPGMFYHLVCAHAGSGNITVYDSKFDFKKQTYIHNKEELQDQRILALNPASMGVWHAGAGFTDGLIVEVNGGTRGTPSISTAIWTTRKTPDNGKRQTVLLTEPGRHVIYGTDCILYEIMPNGPHAGTLTLYDGLGSKLWVMPSVFRGSFNTEMIYCWDGLIVDISGPMENSVSITYTTVDTK